MRTLIAGVGYSNLSDLSIGPIVVPLLRQEEWPVQIEIDDLSYGPIAVAQTFEEASPSYQRLVLISGADRGEKAANLRCYRWHGVLPPADEVQARVVEAVTGVIDLDNLLIVLQQFGALPREVFIIEIQPEVMDFGEALSPAVTALLPEVCRLARFAAETGAF